MKRIKGKATKPERELARALWAKGVRYRKNYSKLPGKPDIAITKSKVAIFIDGEFWHGYRWEEKKQRIKANREYWIQKIERNIRRDQENTKILEENGWVVIRIWEQDIRKRLEECIEKVLSSL